MGKVESGSLTKVQTKLLFSELHSLLQRAGLDKTARELILDLLTESERIMLARRIQIARRLLAGHSMLRIQRELHVGIATISTVHRWLQGNLDGYRSALPPLFKPERTGVEPCLDPLSFAAVRRRYPLHFLLVNLLAARKNS